MKKGRARQATICTYFYIENKRFLSIAASGRGQVAMNNQPQRVSLCFFLPPSLPSSLARSIKWKIMN